MERKVDSRLKSNNQAGAGRRLRRLRAALNGRFTVTDGVGLKSTLQKKKKMVTTSFRVLDFSLPADLLLPQVGEFALSTALHRCKDLNV